MSCLLQGLVNAEKRYYIYASIESEPDHKTEDGERNDQTDDGTQTGRYADVGFFIGQSEKHENAQRREEKTEDDPDETSQAMTHGKKPNLGFLRPGKVFIRVDQILEFCFSFSHTLRRM